MERLGNYDILDRLGAGGMGEVYRARDTKLGRTVAIKVLPEEVVDDPERRERLLREARASAALSHPNICALFEVGGDDTRQYLVFEYVAGETLRQAIAGRALNVRTTIEIGVQLAEALADAHAAGSAPRPRSRRSGGWRARRSRGGLARRRHRSSPSSRSTSSAIHPAPTSRTA